MLRIRYEMHIVASYVILIIGMDTYEQTSGKAPRRGAFMFVKRGKKKKKTYEHTGALRRAKKWSSFGEQIIHKRFA